MGINILIDLFANCAFTLAALLDQKVVD